MVQCPAGKLAGFFMRFTIRDLLWATALVAVVAGWVLDHFFVEARSNAKSAALQNLREEYWQLRAHLDKANPGWDDPDLSAEKSD
jgi:hypothetical protein